jgi:hypothetical protein
VQGGVGGVGRVALRERALVEGAHPTVRVLRGASKVRQLKDAG